MKVQVHPSILSHSVSSTVPRLGVVPIIHNCLLPPSTTFPIVTTTFSTASTPFLFLRYPLWPRLLPLSLSTVSSLSLLTTFAYLSGPFSSFIPNPSLYLPFPSPFSAGSGQYPVSANRGVWQSADKYRGAFVVVLVKGACMVHSWSGWAYVQSSSVIVILLQRFRPD